MIKKCNSCFIILSLNKENKYRNKTDYIIFLYFRSSVYLPCMSWKNIEYQKTKSFGKLPLDYRLKKPHFSDLITNFPSLDNFQNQISIKSKNFDNLNRKELSDVINYQYKDIELNKIQKTNIDNILKENTFTITTGHQLNLLTGPLYFIYKIISVINLVESLNKKYKKYNFVPIYWMASEDHDFKEINNFSIKGKTFCWDSNQTGIVGDFKLNNFSKLVEEFENFVINSSYGQELCLMIKESYSNSNNLADATRIFVNRIFSEYGLIIVDANDKKLKSLFKKTLINEVKNGLVINNSKKSIDKLKDLNYEIQASPREINLFYIQKDIRERIINKGEYYTTDNNLKKWSKEEIIKEIDQSPENFSPNVLLRPLYQEHILPNLCYIGGPAEISYWLELKSVFDKENLIFPLLLSRSSAVIIRKKIRESLEKYNIKIEDIFLSRQDLKNKLTLSFSKNKIDFSDLKIQLNKQFSELRKISKKTDKSFIGALNAQEQKQFNGLDMLEKRLLKSEQKIHEQKISKIMTLLDEISPNDNLQERIFNFSNFYKDYGKNMIDIIKNNLDPLDQKFSVIEI